MSRRSFLKTLGVGATGALVGVAGVRPAGAAGVSNGRIYKLLLQRLGGAFTVWRDQDSAYNHGFPSLVFGDPTLIETDTAFVDQPGQADPTRRLDTRNGDVIRLVFEPFAPLELAGLAIQENEVGAGTGYDLRGAKVVRFRVRSDSGVRATFGVAGFNSSPIRIRPSRQYKQIQIRLNRLFDPQTFQLLDPATELANVHILFSMGSGAFESPAGGDLMMNDISLAPAPTVAPFAPAFPLANETFGVVPVDIGSTVPLDQMLRNLSTIYESALTVRALVYRGSARDRAAAVGLADAFDVALKNDNSGLPLPVAVDGSTGLHSGYSAGDLTLHNDQAGGALAGEARLAGFTAFTDGTRTTRSYFLILDGATGGNNAFAILALLAVYRVSGETKYLDDARTIARWIYDRLLDGSGTGFGGYFLGYPDRGEPKVLIPGKSVENNADIAAGFFALSTVEAGLGNTVDAATWRTRGEIAAEFCLAMFDAAAGRFYAGTVPTGTAPGPGVTPDVTKIVGADTVNTFAFADTATFCVLALAGDLTYRGRIDWRRPVRHALQTFAKTITAAGGRVFRGISLVQIPESGSDGIAWEFTAQLVAAMRYVDRLYSQAEFAAEIDLYLANLALAQMRAPFTDKLGLPASTVEDSDPLNPLKPVDQCVRTPFQAIGERVGLAASLWALFARTGDNVFLP